MFFSCSVMKTYFHFSLPDRVIRALMSLEVKDYLRKRLKKEILRSIFLTWGGGWVLCGLRCPQCCIHCQKCIYKTYQRVINFLSNTNLKEVTNKEQRRIFWQFFKLLVVNEIDCFLPNFVLFILLKQRSLFLMLFSSREGFFQLSSWL